MARWSYLAKRKVPGLSHHFNLVGVEWLAISEEDSQLPFRKRSRTPYLVRISSHNEEALRMGHCGNPWQLTCELRELLGRNGLEAG